MANLIGKLATLKGCAFISIIYQGKPLEKGGKTYVKPVTKYNLIAGASLETAKQTDLETVKTLSESKITQLAKKFGVEKSVVEEVRQSVIKSLTDPDKTRSQAQIDAFEKISNGLEFNKASGELYIWAKLKSSKVLIPGDELPAVTKTLNSAIRKEMERGLEYKKFRKFIITAEQLSKMKAFGNTVYFNPQNHKTTEPQFETA